MHFTGNQMFQGPKALMSTLLKPKMKKGTHYGLMYLMDIDAAAIVSQQDRKCT